MDIFADLIRGTIKHMEKFLKYLVVIGLIIWILLLLFERWSGGSPLGFFSDANTSERCKQYEKSVYDANDDRILGYGGRLKQFISGCW